MCVFNFSVAVGLVHFLTCVMHMVNFCAGEGSCSSQTLTEGSESIIPVATLRSPFVPQTKQ